MTKSDKKLEALLAKHPELTRDEAIKILTEKNERKNKKREEKAERNEAKRLKNAANHPTEDWGSTRRPVVKSELPASPRLSLASCEAAFWQGA